MKPTKPSYTETYFNGTARKLLLENEGEKALYKIVSYISANFTTAGVINCKALKPSRAITKNLGIRTRTTFELLMQKHDHAYSVFKFKRKYHVCVIMKCNSVLPGMAY